MGRRSRSVHERRDVPLKRDMKHAMRAEARGRSVPPTREAYVQLAGSERGSQAVGEAVISRHNQRFENIVGVAAAEADEVISTLHTVPALDAFLLHHGVSLRAHPPSPYGSHADHLRWGVDSAVSAMRFVLVGNVIGAAVVARTQLERWTEHRSRALGVERADGETTSDWYTRVWRLPTELRDRYVDVWGEGGSVDQPAGATWLDLSEVLHGRGALLDCVRWDATEVLDRGHLDARLRGSEAVHHAVRLWLSHLTMCLVMTAREGDTPEGLLGGLLMMPYELPATRDMTFPLPLLWPLNTDTLAITAGGVGNAVEDYDQVVRDGYGGDYTGAAMNSFLNRRARAVSFAGMFLDAEADMLGDDFDPTGVARREQAYMLISEIAGLLCAWGSGPPADALATAACALRASLWLWLEDDDRAMVAARTVLEQTARLRTWRRKPVKAATIEAKGSAATPRDWLEAAGWRRLSILNSSLGEYSHAAMRARWAGAHDVLTELGRVDAPDGSDPRFTARGSTLNDIAMAFGVEVHELATTESPVLAEALLDVLPLGEDAGEDLERWLDRCWAHRGQPLGDPVFRVATDGSPLQWRPPSPTKEPWCLPRNRP